MGEAVQVSKQPSRADALKVSKQLGRDCRGLKQITKTCPLGYPQVVETAPFLPDRTPFPTVFWLTCPLLVKEVSKLEALGWINRFKTLLTFDPELEARFLQSVTEYSEHRRASSPQALLGHGSLTTGISGTREAPRIKCLHSHLAHFLATGNNPIGRLVEILIADSSAPRDRSFCQVRCLES